MRLKELSPREYAGFSYEQASRRAQEVCRIAGESGQTMLALEHLKALILHMAMRHPGGIAVGEAGHAMHALVLKREQANCVADQ